MSEFFEDPFKNEKKAEKTAPREGNSAGYTNATLGNRLVNVIVDGIAISIIGGLLFSTTDNLFISSLISIGYYIYLEHTRGQTLGKMLTQTKVISVDGQKPELSMLMLRSLIRLVPFNWISFFLSDDNTGWHDRWTETRVVGIK